MWLFCGKAFQRFQAQSCGPIPKTAETQAFSGIPFRCTFTTNQTFCSLFRSLKYGRNNPYTWMLGLAISGSVLVFLVICLLYVERAVREGPSFSIELPAWFIWSTVSISLGSFALHYATDSFKKELFGRFLRLICIAWLLSTMFLLFQLLGWRAMYLQDIRMSQNIGGAYIYLISGLHLFHVLLGMGVLTYVTAKALLNHRYVDAFVQSLDPNYKQWLKLMRYYWHFLDVLWILLFALLLILNRL